MINVFLVGDELVAGHGDPKALGWVGRVAARTLPAAPEVRFHGLGVPSETTAEMTARWDGEALRRVGPKGIGPNPVAQTTNAVLFAVGRHDVYQGVSTSLTRMNLANALDRAKALGFRAMLAGPPPGREEDNAAIAELSAVCEEAAARRAVPYVDMFGPLARHEQWLADLAIGDEALPGQAGYGLMAWLVLHSEWPEWLGIEHAGEL